MLPRTVRFEFPEIVLRYSREQRDEWNRADEAGKRALIPTFHEVHPMVVRQPRYHFGEFFTLRHFHQTEGWLGFRFFVLGYVSDFENARYAPGGEQVRRMFPKAKLDALIVARGAGRSDAGDPDLFLYKPTGEAMFLEVKVGADRLHADGRQLQALAQIRHYLGCKAEVVHLVESGATYAPRTYWVEMAPAGLTPIGHG
jgi:hypothetical protein